MSTALHIYNKKAPPPKYVATRNACKLCAPLGACLAMRGIEGAVPFLHGSQGCATYMRRYIISHFKEPMDIAASGFSEASTIFGGEQNLHRGLRNVTSQYHPASYRYCYDLPDARPLEKMSALLLRPYEAAGNGADSLCWFMFRPRVIAARTSRAFTRRLKLSSKNWLCHRNREAHTSTSSPAWFRPPTSVI